MASFATTTACTSACTTVSSRTDDAIMRASREMSFYPLLPEQLEAVRCFMSGRDTFVSLPTGYGKSIIYAILPLAFDYLLGVYFTELLS